LKTYETSTAPSYAARVRVEVYIPKRHAPQYRKLLAWLIDELTELRGGCTVHENASGFYHSQSGESIDERMAVVYSDFQMDWNEPAQRAEVLSYCARLKRFLFENLSEEEILITASPISHVGRTASA
jgi:hypothetical protein